MKKQLFGRLRLLIAPFEPIVSLLPHHGRLLDVGCGHGFVTYAIAAGRPDLEIHGIDISRSRIAVAQGAIGKRRNISFSVRNLLTASLPAQKFDVILFFDLLHHLPPNRQDEIISQSYAHLSKNGILIIKDIDTVPVYKYWWNYFHDFLLNKGQPIYCRHNRQWHKLLQKKAFDIKHTFFPHKGWLYPHFIIVAQKHEN